MDKEREGKPKGQDAPKDAPRDMETIRQGLREEVDRLKDLYRELRESVAQGREGAARPALGERWQDQIIFDEIPEGSFVLDLGCGNGELLSRLMAQKAVFGQGVELDPEAALNAMDKGVPVLNADMAEVLRDYGDQSFDYVILESTLQTMKRPVAALKQILRVGKWGIVTFPSFGHWKVWLDLTARGRMPVTSRLPYQWYDTPNIHLFTLDDFMDFCRGSGIVAEKAFCLSEGGIQSLSLDPSRKDFQEETLFQVEEAILFLTKAD
ncbi:MAG: methionine biosynthesis protein MetW [Deltaproteobacteria bacterium]|jgi:methionine biosynthesis protein MetW|nr:methionine biosynthesis protein MetW [Deltaproteobacteria bacterium]